MRYRWQWLQTRIAELSEILEIIIFLPLFIFFFFNFDVSSETNKVDIQWHNKVYFAPLSIKWMFELKNISVHVVPHRPIGLKRNNQIHITTMANVALNLVNTECFFDWMICIFLAVLCSKVLNALISLLENKQLSKKPWAQRMITI